MAVKLVLFLLVLAIVLSLAVLAAFWYLDNRGEREHEKTLREMEQTHEMLSETETDPIDRELERGKR